jgi:hypothetical protein
LSISAAARRAPAVGIGGQLGSVQQPEHGIAKVLRCRLRILQPLAGLMSGQLLCDEGLLEVPFERKVDERARAVSSRVVVPSD